MKRTIGTALALLGVWTGQGQAASLMEVWQSAPPIEGAVANLDCDAARARLQTIETETTAVLAAAQKAAATAPHSAAVTDNQGATLEKLTDPSLQQCQDDALNSLRLLANDTYGTINNAAASLNENLAIEDAKCGNEMSDGYGECYLRVHRKYETLAQGEARKILDDFENVRANWRNTTGNCIGRREDAVEAFQASGMPGPFSSLGMSVRTMSWSVVYADQQTAAEMCEAIREAAHSFDFNE